MIYTGLVTIYIFMIKVAMYYDILPQETFSGINHMPPKPSYL